MTIKKRARGGHNKKRARGDVKNGVRKKDKAKHC